MADKALAKNKTYKPVNVTIADWKAYDAMAQTLSQEQGFRVSIPNVLRKGFALLQESRK